MRFKETNKIKEIITNFVGDLKLAGSLLRYITLSYVVLNLFYI